MSIMRNMTIKRKLMLIIMLTSTIALLLAGTLNLFHQYIKIRQELIRSISCYAQIIGENCRAAISFEDAKDTSEVIKSLDAESSIVFACIYTKEGKVLASYQRPYITEDIPAPACAKEGYWFDSYYLNLFKGINRGDEVVGTVYIRLDTSEMKAQLRMEAGIKFLFVLICSLVAYLVSLRLQHVISGPIVDLAEIAKVISEEKDYSTRAVKQSNDEVGLLIDAFNAMLEQIQQSDSSLREARDKLETRVRERTMELTHANEQLTREMDEREKVEQQVRQQNEFLNTVLESLTHPFYVVDVHDYTIKMANSAARRLYSNRMSGKMTCHMLSHLRSRPCDTVKDPCLIDEIRRTGKPVVVEHVHYGVDHKPINVEVHAYPIFDDEGELSDVIEYSLDITERKKAEMALKESEGKLKSIVENSSDQIFMLDRNCKFLSINKTAADLSRKSPQEMIGKSILEIFPENIAAQFSKNIKNVFDTGKNMSIEEKMVVQGREFYNSTSLNPIKDDRGVVIAVTGIVRDITEFKQAEQTLRKSENKYRTLIENLPQRVFLKDRDSTYVSCNENYAQDVGIDPDEIKGKTDYEFFPRDLAEKYRRDDKRIVETGITETIEEKYDHAGQEMIVQTVKTPVKDEQGNTIGVLGIFWDITDLKHAQEELHQTNEKLLEASRKSGMAEVAADVLHNVGNVLNSINVSTTMVVEKLTNSELANLEKLARLINDHNEDLGTFLTEHPQGKHIPVYLTEVSKCLTDEQADVISKLRVLADNVEHVKEIISTQQSYAKVSGIEVRASLAKLVEDAIQINSAGLQRHGTQLIREFEVLPEVEIDKQKVLQILVNLISNAKYALSGSDKEEKLLTVRLYKHNEDRFRIEVADNGIGIPEENLMRIFSHGFTTKQHGHGFGLHSGALAAKEMGGALTVHSDGVGYGATFILELPFKPTEVMK